MTYRMTAQQQHQQLMKQQMQQQDRNTPRSTKIDTCLFGNTGVPFQLFSSTYEESLLQTTVKEIEEEEDDCVHDCLAEEGNTEDSNVDRASTNTEVGDTTATAANDIGIGTEDNSSPPRNRKSEMPDPPSRPSKQPPPSHQKNDAADNKNTNDPIAEIQSLSKKKQQQKLLEKINKRQLLDTISSMESNRWNTRAQKQQHQNQSNSNSSFDTNANTSAPFNNNNFSNTKHVINLQELRRLSSQGISESSTYRAVAWRVLLNYLPADTSQWENVLKRDRSLYRTLVSELFVGANNRNSINSDGCTDGNVEEEKGDVEEGRRLRGRGLEKEGKSIKDLGKLRNFSGGQGDGIDFTSSISYNGDGSNYVGGGSSLSTSATLHQINEDNIEDSGGEGVEVQDAAQGENGTVVTDTKTTVVVNSTTLSSENEIAKAGSVAEEEPVLTNVPATMREENDVEEVKENQLNDPAVNVTDQTIPPPQAQETDNLTVAMTNTTITTTDTKIETQAEAIQRRKLQTSNKHKYSPQVVGRNAPTPTHTPSTQDGIAELVPARVREQWKKSGRDTAALARMSSFSNSGSRQYMNALLVVDDQGYAHTPDGGIDSQHKNRVSINDNPLNSNGRGDHVSNNKEKDSLKETNANTKWAQFFENASLLDEIRKDVVRTHPDLQFFLEPEDNLGQRRYAAIERILFVWAKLNKGVRYVQGMNEIVGTMYFVLANDPNEEWACEAEADTYFLFNTLMVEMRDIFVPDLDDADTGIQGRMANMISLLSLHDPEVRCHLDDCGIDPAFYSIRWLTTLLSREFFLPDTIRLWDSMFASTHKDNFMRYVCVTMVMIIREDLLRGDFGACLRLLQSYPPTNVDQLLEASRALWIYESQVTLACHKGGISLSQALNTIAPPPAVIMAYGLNGGLAFDKMERMRQSVDKGQHAARNVARDASNTMATASKSFFGNARGFFGLSNNGGRKKVNRRAHSK